MVAINSENINDKYVKFFCLFGGFAIYFGLWTCFYSHVSSHIYIPKCGTNTLCPQKDRFISILYLILSRCVCVREYFLSDCCLFFFLSIRYMQYGWDRGSLIWTAYFGLWIEFFGLSLILWYQKSPRTLICIQISNKPNVARSNLIKPK